MSSAEKVRAFRARERNDEAILKIRVRRTALLAALETEGLIPATDDGEFLRAAAEEIVDEYIERRTQHEST